MVIMKYLKQLLLFICLSVYCSASAQEAKKAMTFDKMVSWKRITEQKISHDGKWVACKMEPWRGDASIFVYNAKGEMTASFLPAAQAEFSASSGYLLVTRKPELEKVEALKLKKTKKEEPVNIKNRIRKIDIAKVGDFAVIETELDCGSQSNCSPELVIASFCSFAGITTTRDLIEVERRNINFVNKLQF